MGTPSGRRRSSVTINGIERKVYVTLEEGQYLLIDARDKTVKRILIDGTALDAFGNRKKAGKSIFTPMIPGLNTITWNHNFGFDFPGIKYGSWTELLSYRGAADISSPDFMKK